MIAIFRCFDATTRHVLECAKVYALDEKTVTVNRFDSSGQERVCVGTIACDDDERPGRVAVHVHDAFVEVKT